MITARQTSHTRSLNKFVVQLNSHLLSTKTTKLVLYVSQMLNHDFTGDGQNLGVISHRWVPRAGRFGVNPLIHVNRN